uniref:Uncharacterized protein n=1 Tax=Arundo donax TaxID=35708 RepID=A0A0A9AYJ8_ARUDO
MEILDNSKQN